jgi:hypothetical protein
MKDMTDQHALQISNWEKGQSKIIAAIRGKHNEENQAHQKRIEHLLRDHSTLEIDSTQCQRDLQSYQHRCASLEKLIERAGNESRDTIDKLLLKVNEVETKLELCKSIEKESKTKTAMLEEQLVSIQGASNDKENSLKNTIDGLHAQLEDVRAKNQTLLARIQSLEDDVKNMQRDCAKENHKVQQAADQTVNEMKITCEALSIAIKNEKIKSQHAEHLLQETQSLHEARVVEITTEKKELCTRLEKVLLDEREVGKSLMNKVQELNMSVQHLTSEKYQSNHQANRHIDQIYNLEKVIANGEVKLSQFAKQLTRSMQEQERQIQKEVELKKELNTALLELEKLKKR